MMLCRYLREASNNAETCIFRTGKPLPLQQNDEPLDRHVLFQLLRPWNQIGKGKHLKCVKCEIKD